MADAYLCQAVEIKAAMAGAFARRGSDPHFPHGGLTRMTWAQPSTFGRRRPWYPAGIYAIISHALLSEFWPSAWADPFPIGLNDAMLLSSHCRPARPVHACALHF